MPRSPASDPPCALLRSVPSARRLTIAKRRARPSTLARRRAAILPRCLVSGRSVRGRCASCRSRSRVWPRLPSAWPPARAPPPARAASAYAVLINVPGAQSSGTLTSRPAPTSTATSSRSTPTRSARRRAAQRAYGAQRAHGRQPARRRRDGRRVDARTFARRAHERRPTGDFGGAVSDPCVERRGGRRRSRAAQFDDPGHRLRHRRRAPRRALRRRLPRLRGRARTSTSTSTGTTCRRAPRSSLGYADAGASRVTAAAQTAAASAAPRPRRARPRDSRAASPTTDPAAARPRPSCPCRQRRRRRPIAATVVTPTGIEAPPPGGFTLTPPIDAGATAAADSAPSYVFPVAGGAHYGHDFGDFRADTGFHEGSDLFAPGSARRSSQSRRACCTTSAGTASAAGGCGSRTATGNWFYYAHLSAYSPIAKNGAQVQRGRRDRLRRQHGRRRRAGRRTCTSRSTRPASGPCRRTTTCRPGRATATRSPASRRPRAAAGRRVAQLGSTDISAASGLDTAAVARRRERRVRVDSRPRGARRAGADGRGAARRGAGTMTLQTALGVLEQERAPAYRARAAHARASTRSSPSAGTRSRRCRAPLRERLERDAPAAHADARRPRSAPRTARSSCSCARTTATRSRPSRCATATRRTVCLSSQSGCALACTFCATGAHGPRPEPHARGDQRAAAACSRGCCATSRARASRTS